MKLTRRRLRNKPNLDFKLRNGNPAMSSANIFLV
jgi:hypothetical protein